MSPRAPGGGGWWIAVAAMICLLLLVMPKPRPDGDQAYLRNPRCAVLHLALGVVLAGFLVASLSCGGGSSGGGTPPSLAESGTVTETGTSTSISHSTTISVSVS